MPYDKLDRSWSSNADVDSEVSPSGIVRHLEAVIETTSYSILAELAVLRRIRVVEVAAHVIGELAGPLIACLSAGCG